MEIGLKDDGKFFRGTHQFLPHCNPSQIPTHTLNAPDNPQRLQMEF
jgi:hypothetical protein